MCECYYHFQINLTKCYNSITIIIRNALFKATIRKFVTIGLAATLDNYITVANVIVSDTRHH